MLYGDWEGASMTYEEKRATIEKLLDHLEDYVLPSPGLPSGAAETLGFAFTSGMGQYPSVVELGRCLETFWRTSPGPFGRFAGYWSSQKRQTFAKRKIRTATGWAIKDVPVMARLIPHALRNVPVCDKRYGGTACGCGLPRTVCTGVDFVLGCWDHKVPLELPPALNRKLREFVDGEGTHLTEAA